MTGSDTSSCGIWLGWDSDQMLMPDFSWLSLCSWHFAKDEASRACLFVHRTRDER